MDSARLAAPVRPIAALAAALLLGSCTGDDAGLRRLPLEPSASPAKLVVTPAAASLAWIGATGQLRASMTTLDGDTVGGVRYSWRSLDPGVVTVDASGRITSVAEGNGRVVASVLNLADTAAVTVKRLPAGVTLTADTVLITEFTSTVQLGATVKDGGGATLESAAVTWSTSDTAVARVNATGLVTPAGKQGVATITARSGTVSRSSRVRVKVGPSIVQVTPVSVAFTALGDTLRLTGTVLNARGDILADVPVTYTAPDTLVAKVTADGLVTSRAVGSVQLTAQGDTVKRIVQVSVSQTPASVKLSPGPVSITPGGTVTYAAAVTDRNGNAIPSPVVTWSSSDTARATVSSSGVVTAKSAGAAVITAKSGTASDTVTVTVLDVVVDSVALSADSLTLDPGASAALSARFFAAGLEVVGPKAAWTADSTKYATVSSSGVVTAVAQGGTWVRASYQGGKDSTWVKVNAPPSQFDIVIQYVGTEPTTTQKAAFAAAEFRWENIILGDLPPGTPNVAEGACGVAHPAFNSLVDDLHIFVEVVPIDGGGGVLASAGPCVVRTSGGLAIVGQMKFDSADMDILAAQGALTETVIHEMGHVLGFGVGTPWTSVLVGAAGADPYWPGTQAVAQFDLLGGVAANKVPVANTGGEGTRDAHWREATMGRELMTGFLNSGVTNPLSAITIGAMQDMGYVVNLNEGDSYTVSPTLRAGPSGPTIELVEQLMQPRFFLDASGRIRAIGPR